MHWFYDPGLAPNATIDEGVLTGSDGHHAVNALRVRQGEVFAITNGLGLVATCEAIASVKSELRYRVIERTSEQRSSQEVWLYQALAKGDRDELAIQAATELGASGIAAWQGGRSVSRWDGAKVAKGLDRWKQICVEASKQSQRAWFPEIASDAPQGLPIKLPGLTVLLEPSADRKFSQLPLLGAPRINLVVGPEGGFTPQELAFGRELGYEEAKLGSEILRTSTAGPAAIAMLHVISGRW